MFIGEFFPGPEFQPGTGESDNTSLLIFFFLNLI